jgi:hypothetical protein
VKKENNRNAQSVGAPNRDGHPERSYGRAFDSRLNCPVPKELADGAKGLRSLSALQAGPRRAFSCGDSRELRIEDAVVQVGVTEDAQLHQHSDPGGEHACGAATKNRGPFKT